MSEVLNIDYAPYLIRNFNLYADDVIQERALPDIRDGLKPVQRRILYAMYCLGLSPNGQYKKCARTVGETLGRFHPHGDQSVYDALINMAQSFTKRYMLVDGHGNVGSIDGDSQAAMRYVESRLSNIGQLMLQDIDKDTVDFTPNYDESEREPSVLPGLFPQLLCNGSTGIAVGMACNFAPHYVGDIYIACNQIIEDLIDGKDTDIETIIDIIKAPDFPTGGIIINPQEVRRSYLTGKGKITIRGKYNIESVKDRNSIVFTEIPYKVNKSDLLIKIDDLRKNKLSDIKEVRDESDKDGIRIVIDLKKNTNIEWILQNLFKNTPLESSFSINHTAIIDSIPKENIDLKTLLNEFLYHAVNVVKRRCIFDLNKANNRKNIVDGILIALDNIDRVIEIIKSEDEDNKIIELFQNEFSLNEIQSKNIINTRLGSLKKTSISKLKLEQEELSSKIDVLNGIIHDDILLLKETQRSLNEIADLFKKDTRKTSISETAVSEITKKELVKEENIIITVTNNGLIKSIRETDYNLQNRNGLGVKTELVESDSINQILKLTTKDDILFFTNFGYCYTLQAYQIPIVKRNAQGKYLSNYIELAENEHILNIVGLTDNDNNKRIMLFTKNGMVKQMLPDTVKSKYNKIRVISLIDEDIITSVLFVDESDNVSLFTKNGLSVSFKANSIRPSGRTSQGVRAIKLKEKDFLVSAILYEADKYYLTATKNGLVKRSKMSELKLQSRGGSGIIAVKINENDWLAKVVSCKQEDEILIVTQEGQSIRIKASCIGVFNRSTKGVKGIRLNNKDSIIGLSVLNSSSNTTTEEVENE